MEYPGSWAGLPCSYFTELLEIEGYAHISSTYFPIMMLRKLMMRTRPLIWTFLDLFMARLNYMI